MADGVGSRWAKENQIPDADFLYLRVRGEDVDADGLPEPRVFRNHVDEHGVAALSTDWSKYASPEDTRQRARRRPPTEYGVVRIKVGTVRAIPGQVVEHAPIWRNPEDPLDPNNRAHTNVLGPKSPRDPGGDVKIRALFVAACAEHGWAIAPPASE